MKIYNIHEAKTHLSRLIEQAANGEPFIIAKAGKPMAKVVGFNPNSSSAEKRFAFMAGQINVPEDFDHMGEKEITALFTGEA